MRVFHTDVHEKHGGLSGIDLGVMAEVPEKPDRVRRVADALRLAGVELAPATDDATPLIARVHDAGMLAFFETAWDEWQKVSDAPGAIPIIASRDGIGRPGEPRVPTCFEGRLARYCFDPSTPIGEGTWEAVRAAADTVVTAQRYVAEARGPAFALTRPPGHHASRSGYGGYCYVNHAAVAAEAFLEAGADRVAVIDPDYHHGNGTQQIFYERSDVLFASTHADPDHEYPFFSGYADESGAGAGEGFNANFPLPLGTDWRGFEPALRAAVERVRGFEPDAVVVSMGFDPYKDDPISKFRLETEDFARIGEMLDGIRRPTLTILEGGYAIEALPRNVLSYLRGFMGG